MLVDFLMKLTVTLNCFFVLRKRLEICLERKKHSLEALESPFFKAYWDCLDNYNENLVQPLRRFWNDMPSFSANQTEDNDDELIISLDEEWNPFLIVDHSFLEYSEKLLNKEIFFVKSENSLKDFSLSVFRKKLMSILKIDDGQFSFGIPADVKQRMVDLKENKWVPIKENKSKPKSLFKKDPEEKLLSVLYIGHLDTVTQLKDEYLDTIASKGKKRKLSHYSNEVLKKSKSV
jgi:hypothetical protein